MPPAVWQPAKKLGRMVPQAGWQQPVEKLGRIVSQAVWQQRAEKLGRVALQTALWQQPVEKLGEWLLWQDKYGPSAVFSLPQASKDWKKRGISQQSDWANIREATWLI